LTDTPGGNVIDIQTNLAGKFKIANQARVFAGNNRNPEIEVLIDLTNDAQKIFDGSNTLGLFGTVSSYSSSNVTIQAAQALDWYQGTMLRYNTTGAAASGLTNNATYFIDFFVAQPSNVYSFSLKSLPTSSTIPTISGGSGTQTFTQIGVSVDKDVFHLRNNEFVVNDMLRYAYPLDGRIDADEDLDFYFVQTRYDQHNFTVSHTLGQLSPTTISRIGTDSGSTFVPTTLVANGFEAPISFAVTSGVLPTGLTLNTSTGIVTGTANEVIASPGREVVITLTDATGSTAIQTHTYQFNQPPNLYNFNNATFTSGGATGANGPNITQARNGVGNPSWASQYLNMSTTGIQRWTVPQTSTYTIQTVGARGGRDSYYGQAGGLGASIRGDFQLTQGQELNLIVGQPGYDNSYNNWGGGGGGGSFAWVNGTSTPLIAAGGGGTGGANFTSSKAGGQTGTTGGNGTNPGGGDSSSGGTNGNLGGQGNCSGGSGGGWNGGYTSHCGGGFSYPRMQDSGTGATSGWNNNPNDHNGGYGGGGASYGGGGGGGGYSGGGGPGWAYSGTGGGGGSFPAGTNQSNQGASNNGSGFITITRL
jgi:hypothetical protein